MDKSKLERALSYAKALRLAEECENKGVLYAENPAPPPYEFTTNNVKKYGRLGDESNENLLEIASEYIEYTEQLNKLHQYISDSKDKKIILAHPPDEITAPYGAAITAPINGEILYNELRKQWRQSYGMIGRQACQILYARELERRERERETGTGPEETAAEDTEAATSPSNELDKALAELDKELEELQRKAIAEREKTHQEELTFKARLDAREARARGWLKHTRTHPADNPSAAYVKQIHKNGDAIYLYVWYQIPENVIHILITADNKNKTIKHEHSTQKSPIFTPKNISLAEAFSYAEETAATIEEWRKQ